MTKTEPYKGIAEIYEEVRPTYPEQLIEDIITKTGLSKNACLLEIGAGTGKATIPFAARGFTIYANEIGEDMAEILRDKCQAYPKVSIDVMPFEEWQASDGQKFDMIYCAQAFHWIDKTVKYHKCHNLLKDGGHLVLFWYNPTTEKFPESQAIEAEVNQIVQKYSADYSIGQGVTERRVHDGISGNDERKAEILESGLFDLIDKLEYTYEVKNNPSQYLKAMKSVPAFASVLDRLGEEAINRMEDEITGIINRHGGYSGTVFQFTLYIVKRR